MNTPNRNLVRFSAKLGSGSQLWGRVPCPPFVRTTREICY